VEGEEVVNGRARRYYSVTGEGIAALAAMPLTSGLLLLW